MKKLICAILFFSIVMVDQPAMAHDPTVSRWRDEALRVGWTSAQWPRVKCIIHRESHGNPNAYNGRDPRGGSRGLMQINGVHVGWLKEKNVIRSARDLYNPVRNLRAARLMYKRYGWKPWGGRC